MRHTFMIHALHYAIRAAVVAAVLCVLPYAAVAQLPVEAKAIKLQATTGTTALTLQATGVSGAGYALNFPSAQGEVGGFLYLATSDGQLAFANASGRVDGATPRWDDATTSIIWTSPTDANNPNWSRSGNATTSAGLLGTTTAQGFSVITQGKTRMAFAADGAIAINTTTDGGATTTIGRAAGHTTAIDGTVNITGATTMSGTVDLAATTPLRMQGDAGANGEVLVSKGTGLTPEWQNLNESIGIRKTGVVNILNATSVQVQSVDLKGGDAIIITMERDGIGSSVLGTVTARTVNTGVAGSPNGSFTVTLSGTYTGTLNYMIMKAQ